MSKDAFFNNAIKQFEDNPIDALFCYIQSDKELMKYYLDLVAETGSLQEVNKYIGRAVATHYKTRSCGERSAEPSSTLIQSYSILN